MDAPTFDLTIIRGKTFFQQFLVYDDELVYRSVSAMPSKAPARITVTGHGLPENWPARIESTKAPSELNTPEGEWIAPVVVDADTLELNGLNLTGGRAFAQPSVLVYPKPADITGWIFRMQVRDRVGGTVLLSFSSDPADQVIGLITVDPAGSAIALELDAETAEDLSWTRGTYDLEAIRPDGSVLPIIAPSRVMVSQEVTVWA